MTDRLAEHQRRAMEDFCDIEKRGQEPYCFTHHAAADDALICYVVEETVMLIVEQAKYQAWEEAAVVCPEGTSSAHLRQNNPYLRNPKPVFLTEETEEVEHDD